MLVKHLIKYCDLIFNEQVWFVSTLITEISLNESKIFLESGYMDLIIEKYIKRTLKTTIQTKIALEAIDEFLCKSEYDVIYKICKEHTEFFDTILNRVGYKENDDTIKYFLVRILKSLVETWASENDGNIKQSHVLNMIKNDKDLMTVFKDIEHNSAAKKQRDLHGEIAELIMMLEEDAEVSLI